MLNLVPLGFGVIDLSDCSPYLEWMSNYTLQEDGSITFSHKHFLFLPMNPPSGSFNPSVSPKDCTVKPSGHLLSMATSVYFRETGFDIYDMSSGNLTSSLDSPTSYYPAEWSYNTGTADIKNSRYFTVQPTKNFNFWKPQLWTYDYTKISNASLLHSCLLPNNTTPQMIIFNPKVKICAKYLNFSSKTEELLGYDNITGMWYAYDPIACSRTVRADAKEASNPYIPSADIDVQNQAPHQFIVLLTLNVAIISIGRVE